VSVSFLFSQCKEKLRHLKQKTTQVARKIAYMTLGTRIKWRRDALGLSQQDIADKVGVNRVSVSQWERDDTSPKGTNAQKLAAALSVSYDWLFTGKGSPEQSNVEPAVLPVGQRIPVISYVQAGQWREMCETSAFDGNVEFVQAGTDTGPMAFALWLTGESMLPQFKEGDLIIVDPDVQPSPGDFVVAKNGSHEATFKKYRPRGISENGQDVFELVPLNSDYPSLHSDRQYIQIVGVMVEHRSFRKKL